MRRLLTGYDISFNLRHKRTGHFFQSRCKSIVCDEDSWMAPFLFLAGVEQSSSQNQVVWHRVEKVGVGLQPALVVRPYQQCMNEPYFTDRFMASPTTSDICRSPL